ncbi:MAG: winged helix-turn-helix domain-containing protein [Nanoarchaeota archaeon]
MEGIDVVEGSLDTRVELPDGMSIDGPQPTEGTDLEGLLGNEDTILLDLSHRKVSVNDNGEQREVHLTPTEFNLLEYLMMHAGEVVSHKDISNKVWGYDQLDKALQNSIRACVNRLRKKLGYSSHNPIYIQNIRGFGYKFIGAQNKR